MVKLRFRRIYFKLYNLHHSSLQANRSTLEDTRISELDSDEPGPSSSAAKPRRPSLTVGIKKKAAAAKKPPARARPQKRKSVSASPDTSRRQTGNDQDDVDSYSDDGRQDDGVAPVDSSPRLRLVAAAKSNAKSRVNNKGKMDARTGVSRAKNSGKIQAKSVPAKQMNVSSDEDSEVDEQPGRLAPPDLTGRSRVQKGKKDARTGVSRAKNSGKIQAKSVPAKEQNISSDDDSDRDEPSGRLTPDLEDSADSETDLDVSGPVIPSAAFARAPEAVLKKTTKKTSGHKRTSSSGSDQPASKKSKAATGQRTERRDK